MDKTNKQLHNKYFSDKVWHNSPRFGLKCNTLSGGNCACQIQNQSSSCFSFRNAVMLDGGASFTRTELFHSVDQTFFKQDRVLLQLHPQREMAHTSINSSIQSRRFVVSRQHRFFKCWQSDQNTCEDSFQKPGRHDSGNAGPNTSAPTVSHGFDSTVPQRKASARKIRSLLYIFCRRFPYSGRSTPEPDSKEFAFNSSSRRNINFDFSGIHPQSRFKFRTVGQNDCEQEEYKHSANADRKIIRDLWVKKKNSNCRAQALRALKISQERLAQEVLPSVLFPKPPLIPFSLERNKHCCGQKLLVRKTHRKTVLSMVGPFVAVQTVLRCSICSNIFYSEDLRQIVQHGCSVAYDVIAFIGRGLFQRCRTTLEVQKELMVKNVRISISEINYLGRKFISYLALGHRLAMPRIRQKMKLEGGYILHLDATHEGGSPALMTGLDGLSKIVLDNVKVPSENADHIIPFLEKIKKNYGIPKASVHDMGTGICKAVTHVFPDQPDYVCHFHFLRDIGKDFLEPAYRTLRNCLRKHGISSLLSAIVRETFQRLGEKTFEPETLSDDLLSESISKYETLFPLASTYSMASWCLQGKHSGDGYGFPFDRIQLNFAERLIEAAKHLPNLLEMFSKKNKGNIKPLAKLTRKVTNIAKDTELNQTIRELRWRSKIFDRLREAMRIAPQGDGKGLNDDGTPEVIFSIQKGVEQFRQQITENSKLSDDKLSIKMVAQIDKYGDKLFADPIVVKTPNGNVTIYPQRTNNIMEQFFRDLKRSHRRRTGNNSMSRLLNAMLPDTPLIKNLDNPEYMDMLLDGKGNMEELFAEVDRMQAEKDEKVVTKNDRILPGFKAIINLPLLPEYMVNVFKKKQNPAKSNRVLLS